MVHALDALKEAWRNLVPDGILVDLIPYNPELPLEIVTDQQCWSAGALDSSASLGRSLAAQEALEQIVDEGWFSRERETTFPTYRYWDTVDEMETYYAEDDSSVVLPGGVLAEARRLVEQSARAAKPRVQRTMIIGRYRKLARSY